MNTSTIPMIKGTTFGFSHLLSEKATLPFTSLFYSSGVPKATHAPQRSVSFKPFHPPLLSCSHVFNKRWTHFSVWSLDCFQFTIYYSQTLLVSKLPLICDFSCAQTVLYVYWRQLFTRDYWWQSTLHIKLIFQDGYSHVIHVFGKIFHISIHNFNNFCCLFV